MKKITLFLTALLISTMSFAAESLQVTMDFTTNNWGFPEGSANKVTTEATYTNGVFTIKCNASVGHYFHTDGYFLFGKKEATFTFPAFDFKTTKIVVTGRSGASSKVTQNIFVGDQAVSTETTGAAGTNTYEIAEAYQAAGNVYVLTILQGESNSGYNSQITKIEIYGEAEVGSDATMYNVTATVNDEAMGSVSGTGEFAEGSTVVLTAEPKLGYEFVKWEDESTINPRQVTVNADVNVVATFQALPVKTIAEVMH